MMISQAFHLLGVCNLLEARSSPFFSRRKELLVRMMIENENESESVNYLSQARSCATIPNQYIEYNLAVAYGEEGCMNEAISVLESLLRHTPFFEPGWELLVLLNYPVNGYDSSMELVRRGRQAIGDSLGLR